MEGRKSGGKAADFESAARGLALPASIFAPAPEEPGARRFFCASRLAIAWVGRQIAAGAGSGGAASPMHSVWMPRAALLFAALAHARPGPGAEEPSAGRLFALPFLEELAASEERGALAREYLASHPGYVAGAPEQSEGCMSVHGYSQMLACRWHEPAWRAVEFYCRLPGESWREVEAWALESDVDAVDGSVGVPGGLEVVVEPARRAWSARWERERLAEAIAAPAPYEGARRRRGL